MILDDILVNLKSQKLKVAYTYKKVSYSYYEFYKFVCNIYNFLMLKNPNKLPVIVYGHKDVYMKATFLACSYAGITYVPIDESIPKDRVELIINQVKPKFIIGDFCATNCENISVMQIEKIMSNNDFKEIDKIYMRPEDIYYIIFTSGSTGVPKGVKVTYKNVNSCIKWLKEITKAEREVVLNQANFSFDLSVADLYLSLVSGSEHYIIDNNSELDLNKIFEQLKLSNGSIAVMTPSFADILLLDKSFGKNLMPNLKTILFCGEKLLSSTVNKLYSRFDNLKIINSYGPTECTFAVTSIEITKEIANEENIPIGIPKKDVQIYIVDENMNILSDGKIGEILIVGESVSDGYLGNVKNKSFIDYNKKRAYLTGDLGYIKNDVLYYKSRKDNQIKFKGYRIELFDIENNLQALNYIDKAVVIARKNKDNEVLNIISFVKLRENFNQTELEIRKDLQLKIPKYMCPKIKIIKEFPINKNGKCDKKRLMEEF